MSAKRTMGHVSWSDVEAYLEDLEKETGTFAQIILQRQERALGLPMGLKVTLRVTGSRGSGGEGYRRDVNASWPTYCHKTMTGLLLYLVHAMHESLLAERPVYRKQGKAPDYRPG